jgi:hypothetical protein
VFGLAGVLAGTALTKRVVMARVDDEQHLDAVVVLVWLAGFSMVLHTTVAQRIYHFGPMPEQAAKYALLGGLLVGVGLGLDRVGSLTSWAASRTGSAVLDPGLLLVLAGRFVLLSTRFGTFHLVTTVVLSSLVLVVIGIFLIEFALLTVYHRIRWIGVGLALLWLVPAIVPPYFSTLSAPDSGRLPGVGRGRLHPHPAQPPMITSDRRRTRKRTDERTRQTAMPMSRIHTDRTE